MATKKIGIGIGIGKKHVPPLTGVAAAIAELVAYTKLDAQSLPTGDHDFIYSIAPRVWQLSNNVQKKINLVDMQYGRKYGNGNVNNLGPRPVVVPQTF